MKARVKNRLIYIIQIVFTACFIILNTSCGLDEYYVLAEPSSVHVPVYSSTNPISYTERYFEFTTNENTDYDGSSFTYQGTEVYYKIYSNLSTCETEYKTLNTMANTTSTKANAASSLINSYKFQRMKNWDPVNKRIIDSDVLIPHSSDKRVRNVKIRLTKYNSSENNDDFGSAVEQPYLVPFIAVENQKIGIPVRYYGGKRFDFARNDSAKNFTANVPRTTSYEDDVSSTTSITKSNLWYITLYAVGQGYDATFTSYYSNICHLGTLAIDASSYDN